MPFELPSFAQAYLDKMGVWPGGHLQSPAISLFEQSIPPQLAGVPQQMPAPAQPYQLPNTEQPALEMLEPALQENPALANMMAAPQEQPQEEQAASPIDRGVASARKVPLRERIAATDEQQKDALMSAIGAYAHGYANTHSPSMLYDLASNVNPAIAAYNQQLAANEQRNFELLKAEQEEARKAEEAALDREYKIGMLNVSRDEIAHKKAQGPRGGLSDYQYQNLRNGYIDRAAKIDDQELSAIDRATKNLRPTNESHKKIIEEKTSEIRKTYAKKRERLAKEALNFGIDLYGEFTQEPEEIVGEDVVVSGRKGDDVIVKVNGKDVVVNGANFDAQPEAVKAAVLNYKG